MLLTALNVCWISTLVYNVKAKSSLPEPFPEHLTLHKTHLLSVINQSCQKQWEREKKKNQSSTSQWILTIISYMSPITFSAIQEITDNCQITKIWVCENRAMFLHRDVFQCIPAFKPENQIHSFKGNKFAIQV